MTNTPFPAPVSNNFIAAQRNTEAEIAIKRSDKFFRKLRILQKILMAYFKPIVINEDNILRDVNEGVIYVSNHRNTLDPLVITAVLNINVHWAALLRFFEGRDSIFNNSKNWLLCKITSYLLNGLEYFPIERISDTPKASNVSSVRKMNDFLKVKAAIGIFPEGTTRRPENCEFGTFSDMFLRLARKNKCWIAPITIYWSKHGKAIIYFGSRFKISDLTIEQAMRKFTDIQRDALKECVSKCAELYTA